MKKLLFRIKDNTLIVKERIKLSENIKNNLNTNVISCNELIFSDDYLEKNEKIVSTFINELTDTYGIDTIIIEKNSYASLIINLLKKNKNIINLILKEDEQLTFSMCDLITKTYIKNINCYNLQPFMIEYLDKYNCIIESRNEILFFSNFMIQNNLNLFSSLFYKMTLQIDLPMSNQDEEDFKAFCKINKYLKTINVTNINKNDLEFIVETLKKNNKKNIKIVIHENIEDEETINYLKKFNKRQSKRYKINFKLTYSNEYLKENIVKQTNNSILKLCGYIIILIIAFTFGYVFYDNYISMKTIENIKNDINKVITINDSKEIIDSLNKDKKDDEKKVINEDIASLYNVNPEVNSWLTVPNTNIDYPIVQTTNNKYYLSHNIYQEKDNNGWVYMDYRNDLIDISDNIIIYAHNRYYSGVMFGTLQNTMRASWYKNEENHILTLRTLYEELNYKVFSIYKTKNTTDYLRTLFANNEDKQTFFNTLKENSIYDFKVEIDGNDKIITLSTCIDEDNRYVLHAVLQKEAKTN